MRCLIKKWDINLSVDKQTLIPRHLAAERRENLETFQRRQSATAATSAAAFDADVDDVDDDGVFLSTAPPSPSVKFDSPVVVASKPRQADAEDQC